MPKNITSDIIDDSSIFKFIHNDYKVIW